MSVVYLILNDTDLFSAAYVLTMFFGFCIGIFLILFLDSGNKGFFRGCNFFDYLIFICPFSALVTLVIFFLFFMGGGLNLSFFDRLRIEYIKELSEEHYIDFKVYQAERIQKEKRKQEIEKEKQKEKREQEREKGKRIELEIQKRLKEKGIQNEN